MSDRPAPLRFLHDAPPGELFDEILRRLRERRAQGLPPVNPEHTPRERLEAQVESLLFVGGGILGSASVGDLSGARANLVEVLALGIEALEAFDARIPNTTRPPLLDERTFLLASLRRLLEQCTGRIATYQTGAPAHARAQAYARHLILWIAALEGDLAGMVADREIAAAIFDGVPDLANHVPGLAAAIAANEAPR